MDVSSVASTLVPTGAGEGVSSFARAASPGSGFPSQPNESPALAVASNVQIPSSNQVAKAVKQINDTFSQRNQNIYATLGIDKATGIEVVKIVDTNTNETIVQYPSKAVLAAAQALEQPQGSGGQLINIKA